MPRLSLMEAVKIVNLVKDAYMYASFQIIMYMLDLHRILEDASNNIYVNPTLQYFFISKKRI